MSTVVICITVVVAYDLVKVMIARALAARPDYCFDPDTSET
jgi:hypothetical protein